MRRIRSNAIALAAHYNPRIYRHVRRIAMEDRHPEAIYLAEPCPNQKHPWRTSGKRPIKRHWDVRRRAHAKSRDGQRYTIVLTPQLPRRAYQKFKRTYVRLVRRGQRDVAMRVLATRVDTAY